MILVARVGGAVGVRGEIRITTYTEDPMALVRYRDLRRKDGSPALTVLSGRPGKTGLVARVKEAADRDQAEALRGLELYIPRDVLPPPEDEDEFYVADLVGLNAVDPNGETLGQVKSVHDFGAGDLLEIQPPHGASWWLPFTREAVPEVRLAERTLVAVRPTETDAES